MSGATSALRATSKPNRRPMMGALRVIRHRSWQGLILLIAAMVLSSCGWKGISNVAIPGGPGSGSGAMTVYVQVPDTLAINGNSKVMVADVFVGSIKAISAARMALHGDGTHHVSLDKAIKTMRETGADMSVKYKETARGGLALNVVELPLNVVEC